MGSHHDQRKNPVPDDAEKKARDEQDKNKFLHEKGLSVFLIFVTSYPGKVAILSGRIPLRHYDLTSSPASFAALIKA